MISNLLPSNEIPGHDLKQRVTACRKRLRVNRNLHKVQFSDEVSAFSSQDAPFSDEYPAVRESIPGREVVAEFREREAWQRLEQEVGIT